MKLAKKNLLSGAITLIIIALSYAVYLIIPIEKEQHDHIILITVIAIEVICFFNLLLFNGVSGKKRMVLTSGGYTLTLIYFLLTAVVSLIFTFYYRYAQSAYLLMISVMTALFLIAVISMCVFGKRVSEQANNVVDSSQKFKNIEYKVKRICLDQGNSEYADLSEKLCDAIKSCDQSTYIATDDHISNLLDRLVTTLDSDENNKNAILEIYDKLFMLISQRNIEVGNLKMGGI